MDYVKMIIPDIIRLGIVMLIHIGLRTFYNTRIQDMKFDKWKMVDGIIKALIIGLSFMGLSYVFNTTNIPLAGTEVEAPSVIMGAALGFYIIKDLKALKEVLIPEMPKNEKGGE